MREDDDDSIVIHRNFPGDHRRSQDCWCSPLVLTQAQFAAYTEGELMKFVQSRDVLQ